MEKETTPLMMNEKKMEEECSSSSSDDRLGGQDSDLDSQDFDQGPACCCMAQASCQAFCPPATVCPLCRYPHNVQETWKVTKNGEKINFEVVGKDFEQGVQNLRHPLYSFFVNSFRCSSKSAFLKIFCFTRARWLDIVELTFSSEDDMTCEVRAKAFSTGVCPISIPIAPLLNYLLCWVPFSDNQFHYDVWLPTIRETTNYQIEVSDQKRKM